MWSCSICRAEGIALPNPVNGNILQEGDDLLAAQGFGQLPEYSDGDVYRIDCLLAKRKCRDTRVTY